MGTLVKILRIIMLLIEKLIYYNSSPYLELSQGDARLKGE